MSIYSSEISNIKVCILVNKTICLEIVEQAADKQYQCDVIVRWNL